MDGRCCRSCNGRGMIVAVEPPASAEIARLTAELETTRKAMCEAGICIEAMIAAGTDKWHGETLRQGLRQAQAAIRAALNKHDPHLAEL